MTLRRLWTGDSWGFRQPGSLIYRGSKFQISDFAAPRSAPLVTFEYALRWRRPCLWPIEGERDVVIHNTEVRDIASSPEEDWCRQSVLFCLCMKYLGNRWTDLRQIHMEDVFGSSLGWLWRSMLKVKVSINKNCIFRPFFGALRAVYVW